MNLQFVSQFELGDPPQIFLEDPSLDFELVLVRRMLVVTPAAPPKIRASRLHPMRRSLQHRLQPRPREPSLLLSKRSLDCLALQNERKKHSLPPPLLIGRQ